MTVIKQPGEDRGFDYDFSAPLGDLTIALILSVTSEPRNPLSANLVEADRGYGGQVVRIVWSGGVDGETYATTVKIEDSQGGEHELDGEIIVREVKFVVPEIAADPYVSASDYIDRFGREETIRLTDESRTGTIDEARLTAALRDATEEANAYLAVRYDLPLSAPPELVKAIVAALAREQLHRTRPTDSVTAAADRARTQLRDLSAGRMRLNLPAGEEAVARTDDGYAVVVRGVREGAIFNSESMADFR